MKIGVICYPTYGGSGVVATELGRSLSERGHEVHFICYNLPARLTSISNNIYFHLVDVVSYPLFKFPPYTLALASKTADVIEQYQLDIIHAHYAVPHSASAHLAQQIVGNETIKIITTLHGTDIRLVGIDPSYFRVTKYAIEKNNGVTAVSEYLAKVTKEEFNIQRDIRVIPNFVDTVRFRRRPQPDLRRIYAPAGERIVTHVSNFRSLKRVTDVVEIFHRIRRKLPAVLLLVGDGPDFGRVSELVNQLSLHRSVHFLHQMVNVEDVLGISDIFLLPSEIESFGLAVLEAMACQVPVIASRTGGLPEVVVDGACGYLAEVGDIEGMSERAIEVLKDAAAAKRMGDYGRELALEMYSEEKIVSIYEKYYQEVLAG